MAKTERAGSETGPPSNTVNDGSEPMACSSQVFNEPPLTTGAVSSMVNDRSTSTSSTGLEGKNIEDQSMGGTTEPIVPAPSEKALHNLDRAIKALQGGPQDPKGSPILRLASIRIEGAEQVRPSFLLSVLRPYIDPLAPLLPWSEALYAHRTSFKRPAQPTTFSGILALTQSLGADLTSFDLFKDVSARFEPCAHPLASDEDIDIVLQCVKKSRLFLKSSTDIGNDEGTASVQGMLRNVFGGAETLEGSATFGTRTRRAFNLLFTTPVLASPVLNGLVSAYTMDTDLSTWSSSRLSTQGLRAALMYTGRPFQQRELACEASWRQLGHMLPDASVGMRKLGGDSVKAALTHTWVQDTRDDPFLGTRGIYIKAVQELAGLGGSTSFFKLESEVQCSRRLPSAHGLVCSFAARTGVLRTLDGQPSVYADRFHLGGPTSLRMFRQHSLGPRDGLDSLGGDAFWSAGASLIADMPRRPDWPLKLHAFVNTGQLCQIDQAAPLARVKSSSSSYKGAVPATGTSNRESVLASTFRQLAQPSISAGVGLMYVQGPLRVELNAGVPLVARRGDGTRKGLQFGIGVAFL
ncbi:hypothetical protein K437DRAFT_256229 [Tilletiaria anomala UBC 951]|uniref:Bacterial surface antigen (D15) domain-containing protein n=1 Tax=Tilletiaria anomala (strain ATCC 24038 / CBS 436.72 / UBC 951) TaxID=1037660 RepID=A0A066VXR0_TILAU|nr:uncharacterized protein K437DRAFT_256229 [Tilletiaria anomala UBC 951]KDN46266.1 hypothetical protein K437DRAFT_256229 [Tilletiaria anomala UBC 951]